MHREENCQGEFLWSKKGIVKTYLISVSFKRKALYYYGSGCDSNRLGSRSHLFHSSRAIHVPGLWYRCLIKY